MDIGSVILAGGKASRMGGADKAFLPLAGKPLLAHVVARLAPPVSDIVISANGDLARFTSFGLPVIADPMGMGEDLEPVFACDRDQTHCRVPRRVNGGLYISTESKQDLIEVPQKTLGCPVLSQRS